ncbi:MAG: hypothetical protein U0V75_00880 [Ferruginibacter sp.]
MKKIFLLLLSAISFNILQAQNSTCTVMPDSLKGSYDGECSSGKANGFGKAKGADSYEGNFKNGYPDGKGKYTWKNGNFYDGSWKKGLKEGQGVMHILTKNRDSVITGFWKKDNYKGLYEEPYKIIEMGSAVSYKNIQLLQSTNRRSIYVSMRTGALGVANVETYQVMEGYFQRTNVTSGMSQTQAIEFQDVQFPFRLRFTGIDKGVIDIQFFEAAEWKVEIVL